MGFFPLPSWERVPLSVRTAAGEGLWLQKSFYCFKHQVETAPDLEIGKPKNVETFRFQKL